jgi:hypothetical protein
LGIASQVFWFPGARSVDQPVHVSVGAPFVGRQETFARQTFS